MKYVISESKINNVIVKYLDDNFGDLNWTNPYDENGNESDCAAIFYKGDYDNENVVFRVYEKCWWKVAWSPSIKDDLIEKSPILSFENDTDYDTLNAYFGDMWKHIFEEWFKETYGFDLKTISPL